MASHLDTFFDAWSETDESARHAATASATTDGIVYADPRTPHPVEGHDALTSYVGQFSANAPGWTAHVVKRDETDGMIRATVAFGGKGPDGADMVQHGQYFAETGADGRIARLTGFVGTGAPE
jgi:hypothetical protein